jgi:hypothetical protein
MQKVAEKRSLTAQRLAKKSKVVVEGKSGEHRAIAKNDYFDRGMFRGNILF